MINIEKLVQMSYITKGDCFCLCYNSYQGTHYSTIADIAAGLGNAASSANVEGQESTGDGSLLVTAIDTDDEGHFVA